MAVVAGSSSIYKMVCLWAFVICSKNTNGPAATTLDVSLRMLMICQPKQAHRSRWSELRNNLGTV